MIPGAARAVAALRDCGFVVVVVTNQTVVARGLSTEAEVRRVHDHIQSLLWDEAGPDATIQEFRFCPHHPNADLASYRCECSCRKPRSGMILDAAAAHDLDLESGESFLVGDRMSDLAAGHGTGCRTVLVESGRHRDPPIESPEVVDRAVQPDLVCADLSHAADWIVSMKVDAR